MLPGMMDDESEAPEAPVWVQFKDNTTSGSVCSRHAYGRVWDGKDRLVWLLMIKAQNSISLLGLKDKCLPVGEAQRSGNYKKWTLNET